MARRPIKNKEKDPVKRRDRVEKMDTGDLVVHGVGRQIIRCPNCDTFTMFYCGRGKWCCPRCEYEESR